MEASVAAVAPVMAEPNPVLAVSAEPRLVAVRADATDWLSSPALVAPSVVEPSPPPPRRRRLRSGTYWMTSWTDLVRVRVGVRG